MLKREKNKDNLFYYTLIIPSIIIIGILTIYPVGNVIYLSFFKFNFISDIKPSFIGFKNYINLINDNLFQQSFINTLKFCVVATFFEVSLGLFLSLIFQESFKGKKLFMTISIFPMMLSTMIICAVWRIMFHYDIGVLNYIMTSLNLEKVGWLINKNQALLSIALVDIWQWTPFCFLLMQAAMSSISSNIFEAAKIDGANYFTILKKITLPILKPQIFLLIMLRTIDTFKLYSKVYALTLGGPGNATETLSFYIYRQGFSYFNMGIAATASIITLLIVILISIIYIKNVLQGESA